MDLSKYTETYPLKFKMKRYLWFLVNATIFRILFRGNICRILRNYLLKSFGAQIPICSLIYPTCKIWAPWYLSVGQYTCIGPNVQIYNKAKISIGNNSVVSQGAFLCTASHDITDPCHSLITAPIVIEDQVWIAADAFIGMGVTIGEGAVVGARAAVFKDVAPWTIVGGNPAKFIKKRIIKEPC